MQNLQKRIARVSILVIFPLLSPDFDPKENAQKQCMAGKGTRQRKETLLSGQETRKTCLHCKPEWREIISLSFPSFFSPREKVSLKVAAVTDQQGSGHEGGLENPRSERGKGNWWCQMCLGEGYLGDTSSCPPLPLPCCNPGRVGLLSSTAEAPRDPLYYCSEGEKGDGGLWPS